MPTIGQALTAYVGGTLVAWVDVVTNTKGQATSATITVLPGFTATWTLQDTTGATATGTVSCAATHAGNCVQTWALPNADLTNYSAGMGASPYTGG